MSKSAQTALQKVRIEAVDVAPASCAHKLVELEKQSSSGKENRTTLLLKMNSVFKTEQCHETKRKTAL